MWKFHNSYVDVFLTVPVSYPEQPGQLKVSIPTNFSTNIVVAKKPALEREGISLIDVIKEAKVYEKNFKENISFWLKEKSPSLVDVVNWVNNNLSVLGLDHAEFVEWLETIEVLRLAN